MINKCGNCIFGHLCRCSQECEYYTPLNNFEDDKYINEIVEDSRVEYYSAYIDYVSEFDM